MKGCHHFRRKKEKVGENMAATRLIAMHQNKEKTVAQSLHDRAEYAKNGEKTDDGELISSYECNAEIADQEFLSARAEYMKNHRAYKGDIIAYQIRQSFKPGEITPEEANTVGYETAMRFTKGKHAFFVATHIDKAHIHNHILFNSIDLNQEKKFRDFLFSGIALRRVSDLVCLEHGLSVIKPRKPSERDKHTDYSHQKTMRSYIREDIDEILSMKPRSYEEFLQMLIEKNYEIKQGKNIAIRGKNQKRFIRFNSLGDDYSEAAIIKAISGDEIKAKRNEVRKTVNKKDFDLLLDIQGIIAKGKGAGYERWAKVYNIKQISKALLFLQDNNCRDYEELVKRASGAADRFAAVSNQIKSVELRMTEIQDLRTHIINYSKTRDVYIEYRKAGYSKKFYEAHRKDLTLHKAAKDAFKQFEGKKLPKVKELNVEYSELLRKKKQLYEVYRNAKKEMKDYQTAKYDVDRILNIDEEQEKKNHKKERSV